MLRGITTFTCDDCHNRFTAPDIELAATALTMPQPCPKCGSRHTWPTHLPAFLGSVDPKRVIYRRIWNQFA